MTEFTEDTEKIKTDINFDFSYEIPWKCIFFVHMKVNVKLFVLSVWVMQICIFTAG